MDNRILKLIGFSILGGLALLLLITKLSELFFGDLTNEDSYKPLWVIIPIGLTVLGWLVYKTLKK